MNPIFRTKLAVLVLSLAVSVMSHAGEHPSLIMTQPGVEKIRSELGTVPLFDATVKKVMAEVDAEIEQGIHTPVPKDYSGGYTHERHKRNFLIIRKAGVLYQVLDDEKYANYVRDMLFQYEAMYRDLPLHPKTRSYARGKLFWQCLNDANWLVYVSQAYDAIYDYLSAEEREKLEENLFRPFADHISIGSPQFFNRVHNHSTWGNAAVGMIGLVMGDDELVERALYGIPFDELDVAAKDDDGGFIFDKDGKAGFLANLEEPFSPDGYYTEGPYYQRYAMYPFLVFAQGLHNAKPELGIFENEGEVLLKAVDALLNLSDADGEFFPLNDAQKGMSYHAGSIVTAVSIAYHMGGEDPRLLSIAAEQGQVLLDDAGFAVAAAVRDGRATPFEKESVNLSDGPHGEQGGVAVLRYGVSGLELVFKYSSQGLSHGHYDKLSFSLFEDGDEILQDYGMARFVNIEQKGGGNYLKENTTWAKQTVAHNTLVQNETSHFGGNYEVGSLHHSDLYFFDDARPNVQVVSATESNAYPGTLMMRTMAIIKKRKSEKPFVLDIFNISSDVENQYDLPFHFKGHVMQANFQYESPTSLEPLGEANGYQHLFVEGRGHPATGNAKLSWMEYDRFYTLTSMTQESDELFFTRLGANDPEFNLRRDAGFMIRRKEIGNTVFVSAIESHGGYSPVSELAVNSNSSISSIEILRNDERYTVVSVADVQGSTLLFVLARKNASPSSRHEVRIAGQPYQWTGPYSEAIEQITGASGHRFKGSVSGISIRGLGPFLTLQTFNGRQGTTAAASRDMNYQVFPSELTKQITIYKTQQADLIEGGIAGTIDIGTMRPLDFGKRSINMNMRAKYNEYAERAENADEWGYRGSLSYVDQWELPSGNEIGLSLGYSRWDSGNPEETYSTSSNWKMCDTTHVPNDPRNRCDANGGNYTPQDQADDLANGIVKDSLYFMPHSYYWRLNNAEVEERDAVMGALQWRNDVVDATFDFFWSDKFYEDDRHDFILADSRREPFNVVHTDDYALLSFSGHSRMKSDGELYRRDETLEGLGLDLGWKVNDNWEIRTDLSSVDHERNRVRRYVRTQSDYVLYDMVLENGLPTITFYQDVPTSPAGRGLQQDFDINNLLTFGGRDTNDNGIGDSRLSSDFEIRNRMTDRETKSDGVTLDVIWTPDNGGFIDNVKFGVREGTYQRITNNEDDNRKDVEDILEEYGWPEGTDIEDVFAEMVDTCAFDPFPNSKFFNNSDGGNIGGSFAAFDTLCATRLITNGQDRLADPDRTFNERDINVEENTTAVYAMANFSTDSFAVPIWGNFGLRFVDTEVDSKGLREGYVTEQDPDSGLWAVVETGALEDIRHVHSEEVWLPSANVNFEIRDDFMIRTGIYRALSRYNPEFMGANRDFGSINEDFDYDTREEALADELSSASGGNPYIEPFTSWNGDISFEWYLSDDTAFSAAVYYKYFEAEVMSQVEQETIVVDGLALTVDVRKPVLTDDTSTLWGLELTASHVFSNLQYPFDGLGFKVSYNYSDTDFETQDPLYGDQILSDGSVIPGLVNLSPASIYGQSDHVGTLHLFWDIRDLNLSVFWKHRSEYFQPNDGGARVHRWFDTANYLDLSASYRFNDVWRMRVTAQNVTDEAQYGQRGLRHDAPTLWNSSGTRYEIGVTANWGD